MERIYERGSLFLLMNVSDYAATAPWSGIYQKPALFPAEPHRHLLSEFLRSGAANNQTIAFDPATNTWIPWAVTPGNRGASGPEGPVGPQGYSGYAGLPGPQGDRGYQGNAGFQGFQGIQGFLGAIGFQGFQGFVGNQGYQGYQGYQGPQGNQGNAGAQGANGPQGADGAQGNQGPQGDQGPQGPQGAQGPQGDPGGPINCSTECAGWYDGFFAAYQFGPGSCGETGSTDAQNYYLTFGCFCESYSGCDLPSGCNP
jgi:hypothetical protein